MMESECYRAVQSVGVLMPRDRTISRLRPAVCYQLSPIGEDMWDKLIRQTLQSSVKCVNGVPTRSSSNKAALSVAISPSARKAFSPST